MCSSVLEGSEGGVALEPLRDVLGALSTDFVVSQTARTKSKHCQRALTVGIKAGGGVQQRLEGAVDFEALREMLGALISDAVASQTAYKKRALSAGADVWGQGMKRLT